MSRRIALFGASGQIGSAVASALVARGDCVTALQHTRPVPAGCEIVTGSVGDFDVVRRVVGENEIVLQLATTKEDRDHFLDVAVRGTFNILDAIKQRGGCEQFVLAGGDCSVGIWYYPQPSPITEDSPLRAYPGYYALSKVMEETLTRQYHEQTGLPFTILRMGWVHTPASLLKLFLCGRVAGRVWRNMFRTAMPAPLQRRTEGEGDGFVMVAAQRDGQPIRRTTVSLDDVAVAWDLAVGCPAARNQVFNVVHPAWDYPRVGRFLSKKVGIATELVELDAYSWQMDTAKIRAALGWRPRDDVFAMLDQAVAQLRE